MYDPTHEREMAERSLRNIGEALDRVQRSRMLSRDERIRLERLKAAVLDKQNGLAGLNGIRPVPYLHLKTFVDDVVQDMELSDRTITTRLVSGLLLLNATVVLTAVLWLLAAFGVIDGSLASIVSAN